MVTSFLNLISVSTTAPYIILALYILIMACIAYFCRKNADSLDDFLLAGRGLGGWMSAFAYGTTYFSAAIFIGYAGNIGWNNGFAGIWIGLGNAFIGSLLAWIVLAKKTRHITHKINAKTMPEFFEKRYEDKYLKLVTAIIVFVFLIPYSASVYQGLALIFELVFGLDFAWVIIIIAVVTSGYLFFGGYFATAISNFVQGTIMLIGAILMVAFLMKDVSSADFQGLTEKMGFIPQATATSGKLLDSPMFNITIILILTSFGVWGVPQSVHKFYAIKEDNKNDAIKKGAIISTLFAFIIGVSAYFAGGLSRHFISSDRFTGELGGNVDKLMPYILAENLPSVILGILIVLLFAASMSTLSALALSSASTVSVDLYKGYINKNASDKKTNILMKILCIIFIAVSAIFALGQFQAIVTLMSLSWGTLAGCFIGPYIYGLYSKKANKAGAWASVIGTLVITLALILVFGLYLKVDGDSFTKIISKGIGKSPLIGVICMTYSMIATPIANKLFSKNYVSKEMMEMLA